MPFRRRRLTGSLRESGPSLRTRAAVVGAAVVACCLAPALPLAGRVKATIADDPELPRIQARARSFHGLVLGDAGDPVVIALHDGPGGDHRALAALGRLTAAPTETERTAAAALGIAPGERTYRVALYDQRGSGLSPRDEEPASFEDALEDLGAVADAVAGDGPVRLVGQGWGAMLAAAYLGRNPSRVAGAVLIEPLFLSADEGERYLASLAPPRDTTERLQAAWRAYRALAIFGPDRAARADWRAAGRIERAALRAEPRRGCPPPAPSFARAGAAAPGAIWRSLSGADGRLDPGLADLAAGADRYGRSVLLLAGACSPLRDAVHDRHVARFLDARALDLPAAGHDVLLTAPDAAVAAVREHLDALAAMDEEEADATGAGSS